MSSHQRIDDCSFALSCACSHGDTLGPRTALIDEWHHCYYLLKKNIWQSVPRSYVISFNDDFDVKVKWNVFKVRRLWVKKGLKNMAEILRICFRSSALLLQYSLIYPLRSLVALFLHVFISSRFSSVGFLAYRFAYLFFFFSNCLFPFERHVRYYPLHGLSSFSAEHDHWKC